MSFSGVQWVIALYGMLVLVFPMYMFLALWRMGVPIIKRNPEYAEGKQAQENFEQGMKALFNVPKGAVVKAEKKQAKKRASARAEKEQKLDKD